MSDPTQSATNRGLPTMRPPTRGQSDPFRRWERPDAQTRQQQALQDPFAAYENLSPEDQLRLRAYSALREAERTGELHAVPPEIGRWLGNNAADLLESRGLNSAYAARTGRLFRRTGSPGFGRDAGDAVNGAIETVFGLPRAALETVLQAGRSLHGLHTGNTYEINEAAKSLVVEPVVGLARGIYRGARFPFEAGRLPPGERAQRARELGSTAVNAALLGLTARAAVKRPAPGYAVERASLPSATDALLPRSIEALEPNPVRIPGESAPIPRPAEVAERIPTPETRARSINAARRTLEEQFEPTPRDGLVGQALKAANRALEPEFYASTRRAAAGEFPWSTTYNEVSAAPERALASYLAAQANTPYSSDSEPTEQLWQALVQAVFPRRRSPQR
jgi:hypothetical protein